MKVAGAHAHDFQPQHWCVVVLSLTHENNNIFTNKYYESSNVNFIHYCTKGLSKLVFLIRIIGQIVKFLFMQYLLHFCDLRI